jgi:hypothetical protein
VPAHAPVARPTLVRRQIGRRLKYMREKTARMSVDQVVANRRLGISRAKLFRLEAGKHPVKPNDVEGLCRYYGAGEEVIEALAALALATQDDNWWHVYGEDSVPEWFSLYLDVEPAASMIRTYEAELIPGLLQNPAYARAVYQARNPDDSLDEIDRRVAVRMERQAILTRETPAPPPALHVVLNEAAALREVGGAAVMRDQLDRLRKSATRPNISVDILPLKAGAHAAMESAFVILDFPDPREDPPVVYIDNPSSAAYLQKSEDLSRYQAIFDHVQRQAIPILEYQP